MEKKQVLIIEDDPKQASILSGALSENNYEVTLTLDGEEAIKIAHEKDFDVILLDLILPEMGGAEFLKHLKEDERHRNTPVIIITNSDSKEHMASAMEYGITSYFVKAETKLEDILAAVNDKVS